MLSQWFAAASSSFLILINEFFNDGFSLRPHYLSEAATTTVSLLGAWGRPCDICPRQRSTAVWFYWQYIMMVQKSLVIVKSSSISSTPHCLSALNLLWHQTLNVSGSTSATLVHAGSCLLCHGNHIWEPVLWEKNSFEKDTVFLLGIVDFPEPLSYGDMWLYKADAVIDWVCVRVDCKCRVTRRISRMPLNYWRI